MVPPALRRPDQFSQFVRPSLRALQRLRRADHGATMAEYALLIGAIAVVALVGAKTFGTTLNTKLGNEATRVANP